MRGVKTCAHAACDCRVETEVMFCSGPCRERWEARADVEEECRCGHPDCLGERGVQRDDEELTEAPDKTPKAGE